MSSALSGRFCYAGFAPQGVYVEENPMPAKSTRAVKKTIAPSAKRKLAIKPALRCSKSFTFFKKVSIGPGENFDSGVAQDVDCYQWVHVWVLAEHPQSFAMDNIAVELVFEIPGMGATGLANLELPYVAGVVPTPLQVSSGGRFGGYGGFVIRAPIIGPGVRVIVINGGSETYDFTVRGYATH
jgi:hypothetical protein